MSTLYRIRDWDKLFENSKTRSLARLDWVPFSNRHDGSSYRLLVGKDDGPALFGAFIVMVEVASRCKVRGVLIRENDQPHTSESLAAVTGFPAALLSDALEILSNDDIGWIEKGSRDEALGKISAADPHMRRLAHSRVNRDLRSGRGITTCFGRITERPAACQWCGARVTPDVRKGYTTIAHHLEGYGGSSVDRYVIFVCRRCHQLMEHNIIALQEIRDRSQKQSTTAQRDAGDVQCDTGDAHRPRRELKGRERKRREGREEKTFDPNFDTWYADYFRKEKRVEAEEAWIKLTEAEKAKALQVVKRWCQWKTQTDTRKWWPLPASWLNGKRFDDEIPLEPAKFCTRCGKEPRRPDSDMGDNCWKDLGLGGGDE